MLQLTYMTCNMLTKTAVKESMWLIHTFIHNHVQIVFRWYKAVVRLQCSPSCCLYCSKKRKYQHDQESRGTLANINYVLRRQADNSSNVMWGEKNGAKVSMSGFCQHSLKKRIKIHKNIFILNNTHLKQLDRGRALVFVLSSSLHKLPGTGSQYVWILQVCVSVLVSVCL